ncbi:MAG: sensor histidine kinase [Lachnospiraceae bacterium]|nr:sensor histidine kinase [Lachnospiraceae bacterium]
MNAFIDQIKQRFGKRKSLRWSMVRWLLFGWFFPLFMLIFIIIFFVSVSSHEQVEHTIMTSMDKATQIMSIQLKDCETASKNASYMHVISKSYEDYLKDGKENVFRRDVVEFLEQQYQFNDNCRTAELIMLDHPEERYYVMNVTKSKGTYRDIEFFYNTAMDQLLEVAQNLDTATTLVGIEGRVYMVRNLVNSKFQPYAVLTLELNPSLLMDSYAGIWGYMGSTVYWNGELMMGGREDDPQYLSEHITEQLEKKEELYVQGGRREAIHAYRRMSAYGGTMVVSVCVDKRITHAGINSLESLFIILLIFMIPLVVQMMRFFHKKVSLPLKELVNASNMVREGNLGIQIENEEDNEEFYQMKDSFNHMSAQLKNQFDKIYLEEIALRDAKIMALQSQINPHFLNNTLEIINWEARLNGNYKVSGMIEALSTMLGETMNRKEKQFHSIAEEMAYADAYLYIISQRFGAKFRCDKQIDERLMNVQVPRLIIQPIVENAVEHGMDIKTQGRIEIRLFKRQDGYLCIEVEDNGRLSAEDRKKIDRLLSSDMNPDKEKRVSLGIRNVDQRLKMIYGPDCGLFIDKNVEGYTVSTILLKIDVSTEQ